MAPDEQEDGEEGMIIYPDIMEAYVGRLFRFNVLEPIAVYDMDKVLEIYRERDGMSEEDAQEHFEFNVIGAWVGDRTPAFIKLEDAPPDDPDGGI